mgnify:FL=1
MQKYKVLFFSLLFISFSLIGTGIYLNHKSLDSITLTLYGENEIKLYEGDLYLEPGYIARDNNDRNLNKYVTINSNLNIYKSGNYEINYSINNKEMTRHVAVLENPLKNIDFTLLGSSVVNILLNEEYTDPLFTCIDKQNNIDLKDKVTITNNIDYGNVGSYYIKYTLNLDSKSKTLTRVVNVLDEKYAVNLSNENMTNQDITLNFTSNIPNFLYVIGPDNSAFYSHTSTWIIQENGNYYFTVYDNNNNSETYKVTINNIDKTPPKILACSASIDNNKTTYYLKSNDNDLLNVNINGNTLDWKETIVVNGNIEKSIIKIYDKASNETIIDCPSYYKPSKPKEETSIIFKEEKDTIKVWIEKINRQSRTGFYVTHIWAQDPYNQLKTNVPSNFGKDLEVASSLFNKAINKNNLQNKLSVAINASGFVFNGYFGQVFYNANHSFNKTSTSPIVIVEGKVLRDLANENLPSSLYSTYGLKKDGMLASYKYVGGYNQQSNMLISNKIISDGVLNTFAFTPVLVENGALVTKDNTRNLRQGFCQIDKNNFLFITDIPGQRNGFSFRELGSYMIKLGCKTGFNLDGGGSISLIVKGSDTKPQVIAGNNRKIADILYFHE